MHSHFCYDVQIYVCFFGIHSLFNDHTLTTDFTVMQETCVRWLNRCLHVLLQYSVILMEK